MNVLKIIPEGIPDAWLAGTRVLVISDYGEEVDISHLVTAVSWSHRAGELPVCIVELFALKGDGVVPATMKADNKTVWALIGEGQDIADEVLKVAMRHDTVIDHDTGEVLDGKARREEPGF